MHVYIIEGPLEVKLPTIWTDEKQSWEESEKKVRREGQRREEEKKEDQAPFDPSVGSLCHP